MAKFPDIPPSSITLEAYQPSAKSRSINAERSQARSSGIFLWQVKFNYTLLDFDQRDIINAFLIAQKGRAIEFDVLVPTHSENVDAPASLLPADGIRLKGDGYIAIRNMVGGELKIGNLLRLNGKKGTHMVTEHNSPIGGVQTVGISPPLRDDVADGDMVIIKDVPINVALDDDSVGPTSGANMSASISFSMIEEPR